MKPPDKNKRAVPWPGPRQFRLPGPIGAHHHTTPSKEADNLPRVPSKAGELLLVINGQLDVTDIDTLWPDLWTGMYNPRVVTLSGGPIYKFTSSRLAPSQQVASPWWFTDKEFQKIRQYFRLDSNNLGFIARSQAAVHYKWSDMDTLVCATVVRPIRVFIGPGEWQYERTEAQSTIVFQAPPDLGQMYIPNIVDPLAKSLNANGKRAFGFFRYIPISSGDATDQFLMAVQGKTIFIVGNPSLH